MVAFFISNVPRKICSKFFKVVSLFNYQGSLPEKPLFSALCDVFKKLFSRSSAINTLSHFVVFVNTFFNFFFQDVLFVSRERVISYQRYLCLSTTFLTFFDLFFLVTFQSKKQAVKKVHRRLSVNSSSPSRARTYNITVNSRALYH